MILVTILMSNSTSYGLNWFRNFDLDRGVNKFLGSYDDEDANSEPSNDDSDDSDDDIEAVTPAKKPLPKLTLRYKEMLIQNNGWECGFYAIFHYFARKNNLSKNLKGHYADFKKMLFKKNRQAKTLYDNHTWLSNAHITQFLTSFDKDDDTVLLLSEHFLGILPTDIRLFEKIPALQASEKRFWVIINHARHWTCHEIKPSGECLSFDSIKGYSLRHSRAIILKMLSFVTGRIVFPSIDTYDEIRTLLAEILTRCDKKQSLSEVGAYAAIQRHLRKDPNNVQANALNNGFTEESFDELVRRIARNHAITDLT